MKAELFIDSKSILGEGPVWHQDNGHLYWVDIEGKKINRFNTTNGFHQVRQFNEMPGALALIDNHPGKLLIAFSNGLATYDWETKMLGYKNWLGRDTPKIRANDGKCDPNGNFWVGTMHLNLEQGAGTLYRIDGNFENSEQFPNRTISNGMAWTKDGSIMYYIDTFENKVFAFDYDIYTSGISNKRVAISIDAGLGGLDGMTIDNEGNLWIAHWGGACVRCWNPQAQKIVETVEVPAPHVTSCTFGGTKMNELFITTARSGLTEQQLAKYPHSGGVFKVITGSSGRPTNYFKIK